MAFGFAAFAINRTRVVDSEDELLRTNSRDGTTRRLRLMVLGHLTLAKVVAREHSENKASGCKEVLFHAKLPSTSCAVAPKTSRGARPRRTTNAHKRSDQVKRAKSQLNRQTEDLFIQAGLESVIVILCEG